MLQLALTPAKLVPFIGNPLQISQPVMAIQLLTSIPYNLLWFESILYYLLRKKRISLAHEMGHDLATHHFSRKYNLDLPGDKAAIKLRKALSSAERGQMIDWGQLLSAEGLSPFANFRKTIKSIELYKPEQIEFRQRLQDIYRDYAVTIVAATMLDSFLNRRIGPPTDFIDKRRFGKLLKMIALLEKQPGTWKMLEKKKFVEAERKRAYKEAEAFFTSLDFNKVNGILQHMISEAKAGKKEWSIEEMDGYYKTLQEPA